MKIGIDGRVLMDGQYSGVGEYVHNLVKNLLAIDTVNEYYIFYNSARQQIAELPKFQRAQIVKTSIPNKLLNYGLFKTCKAPTINKLMGVNLDVFLMPHINFVALSPRTKNILTVHDVSFLQYPEFFSARQNFWHRSLAVKKLTERFDQVVAISENTKRDLMEQCHLPADKIKVIYSGVDDNYKVIENKQVLRQTLTMNLPEQFILYLGTIEPRKNIVGLIRAYELLRERRPDLSAVKLVIAGGRGWNCADVYATAAESKFAMDIIFTGYVSIDEKLALYNLATVFAFPSFYEGFGFPPLEAAACGLPVVVSSSSSLTEVAGAYARLVDPDDIGSIADGLIVALTDGVWRQRAVASGLQAVKNFNWQKTARQYLKLWQS